MKKFEKLSTLPFSPTVPLIFFDSKKHFFQGIITNFKVKIKVPKMPKQDYILANREFLQKVASEPGLIQLDKGVCHNIALIFEIELIGFV